MTTNPSEQTPDEGSAVPSASESSATPPPSSGYTTPPSSGYTTPPSSGYTTPPSSGYTTPPSSGYTTPSYGIADSTAPLSDADQRLWAMLAHLGGLLGFLAPLIIWVVFRERGRYVEEQSKESLNFQITVAIAWVVIFIVTLVTLGFASPMGIVLWIGVAILCVIAGMAANKGEPYRYPATIRFIK